MLNSENLRAHARAQYGCQNLIIQYLYGDAVVLLLDDLFSPNLCEKIVLLYFFQAKRNVASSFHTW